MNNDYVTVTGRSLVDKSNLSAWAVDDSYHRTTSVSLAYECNDGVVGTLVFEYEGGTE